MDPGGLRPLPGSNGLRLAATLGSAIAVLGLATFVSSEAALATGEMQWVSQNTTPLLWGDQLGMPAGGLAPSAP